MICTSQLVLSERLCFGVSELREDLKRVEIGWSIRCQLPLFGGPYKEGGRFGRFVSVSGGLHTFFGSLLATFRNREHIKRSGTREPNEVASSFAHLCRELREGFAFHNLQESGRQPEEDNPRVKRREVSLLLKTRQWDATRLSRVHHFSHSLRHFSSFSVNEIFLLLNFETAI
jgi:hypothetical protein